MNFAIKKSRDFTDGPKLIFQMIQAILCLNEKDITGITLPLLFNYLLLFRGTASAFNLVIS